MYSNYPDMKKWCCILFIMLMTVASGTFAQCSICTKTAQQLGERPAKALNAGIIYLAIVPMGVMGYVGYRWWKSNRAEL